MTDKRRRHKRQRSPGLAAQPGLARLPPTQRRGHRCLHSTRGADVPPATPEMLPRVPAGLRALPLHSGTFPEQQHELRLLSEKPFGGRSHGGDGACAKLGRVPTLPIAKRLLQTASAKFKEPKNAGREPLRQHAAIFSLPRCWEIISRNHHRWPLTTLRAPGAASAKVASTCVGTEKRFNGLIAILLRRLSWRHSTSYLRRAILPSPSFYPSANASAITERYSQ